MLPPITFASTIAAKDLWRKGYLIDQSVNILYVFIDWCIECLDDWNHHQVNGWRSSHCFDINRSSLSYVGSNSCTKWNRRFFPSIIWVDLFGKGSYYHICLAQRICGKHVNLSNIYIDGLHVMIWQHHQNYDNPFWFFFIFIKILQYCMIVMVRVK